MDKQKALLAVGIGTATGLAIAGLFYTAYNRKIRVREGKGPLSMQSILTANSDDDDDDGAGELEDIQELKTIEGDKIKNYKPLHAGHVDAVQYIREDGVWHDVLLQYCQHDHKTIPFVIDNKLFAKPMGRVVFEDGSTAIVYKGDASYVLFGHNDRANRLVVITSILYEVLQALILLKKYRRKMDFEVLRESIVVNSASKTRLLGAHAVEGDCDVTDQQIIRDFVKLCDLCLHDDRWDVGGEKDHAIRLFRSISEAQTIQGIEKKLIPGHQHTIHRH